MRLLADENLDPKLVEWLRAEGHDVFSVKEALPGASDEEVMEVALRESRAILTRDKDFGELVIRNGQRASGVILIRLQSNSRAEYIAAFAERWPRILPHLHGNLVVLKNASLRVRPL